MLFTYAPIPDAPWYITAAGILTPDSLPGLIAAIQAAAGSFSPVVDITDLSHVDSAAGETLAGLAERGVVSLFGANLAQLDVAGARLRAAVRESRLEASEALLELIRRRRHEGIADDPAIEKLLGRMRGLNR